MTIMIRIKSFNLFGVNLGPFSAHDCPDVHFRPAVVDWVVEGVALLLVVLGWVGVLWQYTSQGGQADGNMWVSAFLSTLVFALMVTGARLPVRFIRFPVRVNARPLSVGTHRLPGRAGADGPLSGRLLRCDPAAEVM